MIPSVREQLLALVLAARDDVRTCRMELGSTPAPPLQATQSAPRDVQHDAPPPVAPTAAPTRQRGLQVAVARLRV